jgi:hypothetical protein
VTVIDELMDFDVHTTQTSHQSAPSEISNPPAAFDPLFLKEFEPPLTQSPVHSILLSKSTLRSERASEH